MLSRFLAEAIITNIFHKCVRLFFLFVCLFVVCLFVFVFCFLIVVEKLYLKRYWLFNKLLLFNCWCVLHSHW